MELITDQNNQVLVMHKAKLQSKGESDWLNICCCYNFARSVKFKHFKSLHLHNYLKKKNVLKFLFSKKIIDICVTTKKNEKAISKR